MKKNDLVELNITDLSDDGMGIGRAMGTVLFVQNAFPGDRIEALILKLKKNYGFAKLVRILEPSASRIDSECPVCTKCGGCSLSCMTYESQLRFKQKKVFDCMNRIGGLNISENNPVLRDIIGMDDAKNYRNKAQYPVGTSKEGRVVTGFYGFHSHNVIPSEGCMLQHKINVPIMRTVRDFIEENGLTVYNEATGKGLVRHVLTRVGFATHEVMVCIVINGESLSKRNCGKDELASSLADQCREAVSTYSDGSYSLKSFTLNVNKDNTNVVLGRKLIPVLGDPFIHDFIGEVRFRISPLSFFQVNPKMTKRLYDIALEFAGLTGNETVFDLYCGIGTISLFLAKMAAKVIGIEIVPDAIRDAKENAKLNGITNAEFLCGAAEDVFPDLYEKRGDEVKADVVVVDPPRKGCDQKLLETIVTMLPQRIVYVSCDPATLARDIAFLAGHTYSVMAIQPVDQFPATVHVECVVLLSKTTE